MKKLSVLLITVLCYSLSYSQNASPAPTPQPVSGTRTAAVAPVEGIEVGNKAPEIALQSPDGKVIALSSLKGKMVLLDFWASWCGPCRGENPNVVSAYNKYKTAKFKNGKGFTVYSVSLDKAKDAWVNAIQQDKLVWPNHVSDLKWWYSDAAKAYGVQSIPTNWLLDSKGIIVGKNLRGPALDQALENLKVSAKKK